MFKEMMKKFIDLLVSSYEETYGCEELAKEFYEEVKRIQKENRENFLLKEVERITKRYIKKNGKNPTFKYVMTRARKKFDILKEKGEIDDLNNTVE